MLCYVIWWKLFHEVFFLVDSFHRDGGKTWNPWTSRPTEEWHLIMDETVDFEYTKEACYTNPFPEF
jgi:hypothetical protein